MIMGKGRKRWKKRQKGDFKEMDRGNKGKKDKKKERK